MPDGVQRILSPAQTAAATCAGGLLVVPSGAGTGKTTMLVARMAHLVDRPGANPSRIVAVTFTRKAAHEMKERLAALRPDVAERVRIGTIHWLAAMIVRRRWREAGLSSPELVIIDEDGSADIMAEAVSRSGADGPDPVEGDRDAAKLRREFVKECCKVIGRWKENGLTAADAAADGRPDMDSFREACAAVFQHYSRGIDERGVLDFSDLALLATRVLSNQEVLDEEAGEVEWLLVDEYQDTNASQTEFLRRLASRAVGVTVVGDADQSLYSWRGAVPAIMDRASEMFPSAAARGVRIVPLVENRRCTDEILRPANLLVDYNKRTDPKVLASGRQGSLPTVLGHPTDKAEAQDCLERVRTLISSGTRPEEIAILARTGAALDEIGRAFALSAVPHVMQSGLRFMERGEVMDVMAYLRLALRPSLDVAFIRIAAKPTRGVGPATVQAVLRMVTPGMAIHEALALAAAAPGMRPESRHGIAHMGRQLEAMASAARSGELSEAMVRFVLEDVGYSEWAYMQADPPRTLRASLDSLLDMAREQPSFVDFMVAASVLDDPAARAATGVHVGTLHGSKGLEWDHVIIVAVEERILPNERALEEARQASNCEDPWDTHASGGLEEERRLLHVGMTRARHSLHLSYACMRGSGSRRKEMKPSRFIREAELENVRARPGSVAGAGARKKSRAFW